MNQKAIEWENRRREALRRIEEEDAARYRSLSFAHTRRKGLREGKLPCENKPPKKATTPKYKPPTKPLAERLQEIQETWPKES